MGSIDQQVPSKEDSAGQQFVTEGMDKALLKAQKLAKTKISILLQGETGVGKEDFAKLIHVNSPRKNGPFVPINVTAIPFTLFESELFGHEKGAFTGAERRRTGLIEEANGGTLFLDEIGELALGMQAKLLRVLEEGEVILVGSSIPKKVDIRVISATNKNLADEIKDKKFRQDLFYRLGTVTINIPPLRDRLEAIPILADLFLKKCNEKYSYKKQPKVFSPEALAFLQTQKWNGNIRELQNTVESAYINSEGDEITLADIHSIGGQLIEENEIKVPVAPAVLFAELMENLKTQISQQDGRDANKINTSVLNAHQKLVIEWALDQCEGDHAKVAKMLRMPLKMLLKKLKL